jgi:hypothetical protein
MNGPATTDPPSDSQAAAIKLDEIDNRRPSPGFGLTLPAIVAGVFTLFAVHWTFRLGRLTIPPTLDDVGYFLDAIGRMRVFDAQGVLGLTSNLFHYPPHSASSTALALLAFELFGVHDWPPYILSGLIVFMLLIMIDRFAPSTKKWQRLLIYGLALSTRYPWATVSIFKPDMAWGLLVAAASLATLLRPLFTGDLSRPMIAGAFWGAAMLCKSSTAPVTAAIAGTALLAAVICDWREMRLAGVVVLIFVGLLIAGPYYASAWREALGYFYTNALGSQMSWWSPKGDFWYQSLYYVNGDGGNLLLGWHVWVLMVIVLLGAIAALSRRPDLRPRIISLAIVLLITYLIPTISPVKGPSLGAAFSAMLLLAAAIGLAEMFTTLSKRQSLLVALAILPIIFFYEPDVIPWWHATHAANLAYNQESDQVLQLVTSTSQSHRTLVLITNEGRVTGFQAMQYRADERNLPLLFTHLDPFVSAEQSADQFSQANFILAGEGGCTEFPDFLATTKSADEILNWIRQSAQFQEIASIPSSDGHHYHLFANRQLPAAP